MKWQCRLCEYSAEGDRRCDVRHLASTHMANAHGFGGYEPLTAREEEVGVYTTAGRTHRTMASMDYVSAPSAPDRPRPEVARDPQQEEIRYLKALVELKQQGLDKMQAFLEREGYRSCDIAACNCGSWHQHRERTVWHFPSDDKEKDGDDR